MKQSTCKIDGCLSAIKGHGWCQVHYARWRKHGDPEVVAAKRLCRYCETEFTPTNGRQVVCVPCKPKKSADYQSRYKDWRKAWEASNRERLNEYNRIRRGEDRERSREYARLKSAEWRKTHPDYSGDHHSRRRARLAGSGRYAISQKQKNRSISRNAGKCVYCNERPAIEWDHVVPIVRGGRHAIGNLVPACRTCNASKGARTLMEWRIWKERY